MAAHSFSELFTEVVQPSDGPGFLTLFCMGKGDAIVTSPRQALGDGHQRLHSTWSPQGRKAGGIALPQATEGRAQAVEWDRDPAQMPARAMTVATQEPQPQWLIARCQ